MKAIQAKDLTDEHWKLYAKLDEDLNTKYYPEERNKKSDWQDLKRENFNEIEIAKEDFLNFHLLLENEKAAGWLGTRMLGGDASFVFDADYDEIPDKVMETVFDIAKKFLSERGKTEIYSNSKRDAIIKSLTKAGGEIIDRKIYTKLTREEIDLNELRKITESLSEKIKYKLVLYDTIPEEILDRYVEILNEARLDMDEFNPHKKTFVKRSREDVLKKLKWDKGPNDEMYMYMLFDNEKIAAFCSLFVREPNKHMIDQAGGLTTVGRNYRGQNLAKYLKAKIYIKMLEEHPDFEFIRTDTYPWNKYMYRINEEFGFKPYEEYCEIKLAMNNEQ
ncbi:MAG: GNAT family N-acetyltransferase [Ignavibacteria bacterium]|nr:GNAT family N-acetyltransferase [Ignavibacteria bacterium]